MFVILLLSLDFLILVFRLNSLLRSDLVDDFVAALELLSSPELIFKVRTNVIEI